VSRIFPIGRSALLHGAPRNLLTIVSPTAGDHAWLGAMLRPDQLPEVPSFTPRGGHNSGLDVLSEAALHRAIERLQPTQAESFSLHARGSYNSAACLPPKVVKKLLSLEFVEMNELLADIIWPDDPTPTTGGHTPWRPGKQPH
jgi:hypothetical protein